MLRLYQGGIAGRPPRFPGDIEARIDAYLATRSVQEARSADPPSPGTRAGRRRNPSQVLD